MNAVAFQSGRGQGRRPRRSLYRRHDSSPFDLKRYALALLAGLAAALTLPPVYIYPLLLPAYSGLLLLIMGAAGRRQAFATGWWFGLGYFVAGLYWFAYALLVEPEKFAWMIPFAVLGLPSILAVYYGLAALLAWHLPRRNPLISILGFALIWLGAEWLRGHLFTGFPWNLQAIAWGFSTVMIQPAALIGSYGLTGWTILLAALPAVLFWPDRRAAKPACVTALSLCFAMLALPFGFGVWRLSTHPTEYTDSRIRIVQGNIPQGQKWLPERRMAAIAHHAALSALPGKDDINLFVWSETAFPFVMEEESPPAKLATGFLPPDGLLITGAVRAEPAGQDGWRFFNALHLLEAGGLSAGHYDKIKLVPFGEFVPFRDILPLRRIAHGMEDFTAGEVNNGIDISNIGKFLPLICYEVIFPETSENSNVSQVAQGIINITNDAWFGMSSGPYQHAQMGRLRAVEMGVPIVRAANTGISYISDGYGRILGELELGREGIIDATLPRKSTKIFH